MYTPTGTSIYFRNNTYAGNIGSPEGQFNGSGKAHYIF